MSYCILFYFIMRASLYDLVLVVGLIPFASSSSLGVLMTSIYNNMLLPSLFILLRCVVLYFILLYFILLCVLLLYDLILVVGLTPFASSSSLGVLITSTTI